MEAVMAQTMTLQQKSAALMQVTALRKAGKNAEADVLVRTVPIPSYLAEGWKKMGYGDYLVRGGWNMTEVEAELGKDWLAQ
ncbi:MAG: hypothetical protein LBO80_10270 [Treponema sp.]|jgi:hypothetical protein|nr:hypothetical protein [Treponema sp.]